MGFFCGATKIGAIVRNMVALIDAGTVLFGSTRQAILAMMFLWPEESFYLREIVRRSGPVGSAEFSVSDNAPAD